MGNTTNDNAQPVPTDNELPPRMQEYLAALDRFNTALRVMAYDAVREAHPEREEGGYISPDGQTVYAVLRNGQQYRIKIHATLDTD